jgi:peptide deformylase
MIMDNSEVSAKVSANTEIKRQPTRPRALDLVYGPSPLLRTKSLPVEESEFGEALENFTKIMLESMINLKGAGLAAVQVGLLKRLFVANIKDSDIVMVNPEIVDSSEEMLSSQEGCLSLPLYRFGAIRHKSVTVKFRDPLGNKFEETYFDEEAVVIQHEIEHLDGITLLSKVSRLKQDIYKRKFRKLKKKLSRSSKRR